MEIVMLLFTWMIECCLIKERNVIGMELMFSLLLVPFSVDVWVLCWLILL